MALKWGWRGQFKFALSLKLFVFDSTISICAMAGVLKLTFLKTKRLQPISTEPSSMGWFLIYKQN